MTEQVKYTGTARAFSTAAHGGVIARQNEPVDVDDDVAAFLVETHDFERVSDAQTPDEGGEDGDAEAEGDDSDAGEWMVALDGVGEATADKLEDAGYATVEDVQSASAEDLAAVDGVSEDLAESIKEEVAG